MNLTINENKIIMEFENNESFSQYQSKMIKLNDFNELLKYKTEISNNSLKLEYDVVNYISLDDYVRNNSIRINELKLSLSNLENKIKNYMLLINNVMLDSKYIYINKIKLINDELEFKYIYVPLKEEQNDYEKNKEMLFDNKLIFEYKKEINTEELQEQLLDDLISDDELYEVKIRTRKIIKILIVILFLILLYVFRNYKLATLITVISFAVGFLIYYIFTFTNDEKEYQDSINDETVLLENYPYLKKGLLDDKILIMKNIFTIGKDNKNDLVINEPGVSKSHARIIKKNSDYYVMDSNSKNHTYVNNEELQNNDCRLLLSGDKIRFGKEQFQFHYDY